MVHSYLPIVVHCYLPITITKHLIDQRYFSVPGSVGKDYAFPLYLYPKLSNQLSLTQPIERTPNLNPEIVAKIAEGVGSQFVSEKEAEVNVCFANDPDLRPEFPQTFAPIDLLDYIYAVLHSVAYREKYKEFLKIDFPRVPYPKEAEKFWQLVKLGGEIRQIHLLESPVVEQFITQYQIDGDNVVVKPEYKDGNVYINEIQYFANVPLTAWEFYIGGYQPAQKWLKDRKGRILEFDDILHYQKIIVALTETARLMEEIDSIFQF
ncbi:type ISP restriction/modification enzyme [Dyadobacter koreensis]|uniref:type ISP restriction/modification enzyme n=1 Tax=Dyadobacter koreensis TaxID=408657 RepID=UPI000B1DBACF|nr:type ISP restriction/modification enzyme [Dyadobacter koreensis]